VTRSRRVLETLLSGSALYVLMAACSSGSSKLSFSASSGTASSSHASTTGGGGLMGTGGTGGTGQGGVGGHPGVGGMVAMGGHSGAGGMGVGGDSGIFDALTDPVPDANAGGENPTSGTRLKGKYTMGSDGSKEYQLATLFNDVHMQQGNPPTGPGAVHAVWYDSMLMADCSFLPASDGTLRCLPGLPAPIPISSEVGGSYLLTTLFTDAGCTQPIVAETTAGCAPVAPQYVIYLDAIGNCWFQPNAPSNGQPTVHVLQVGTLAATPAKTYGGSPGNCYLDGVEGNVLWYSATELPPSTFVQGTTGIDP
jgi:hypothetical protein